MHILSEGVPMTHGEVYALLRRRRDERSAAAHLPFGLQRAQADPHSRTSNQAVQYTKQRHGPLSGGGGEGGDGGQGARDGIQRQAVAMAAAGIGGGGGSGASLLPPTAADVEAMNGLLASPAAGHLAVLLTEVRVLHYLAQHAAMPEERPSAEPSRTSTRAVHGPSTVYDLAVRGDEEEEEDTQEASVKEKADAAAAPRKKPSSRKAGHVKAEPREDDEEAGDSEAIEAALAEQLMKRAITRTLVGTKSHVRCVGCALAYYEAKGRRQERAWAQALRSLLADAHARGLRRCHGGPQGRDEEGTHQRRAAPRSPIVGGRFPARSGRTGTASAASELGSVKEEEEEHPDAPHAAARTGSVAQGRRVRGRPGSRTEAATDAPEGVPHTNGRQHEGHDAFFAASSTWWDGRPLLSLPPSLVTAASEENALLPTSASATGTRSSSQRLDTHASTRSASLLSESEVMSLVMSRPTSRLQVHQLLDSLDSRFGGNEEAVEHLVDGIVAIFKGERCES